MTGPERFGALEQYKLDQYKLEIDGSAVICMASDLMPIDNKNWYAPAWMT